MYDWDTAYISKITRSSLCRKPYRGRKTNQDQQHVSEIENLYAKLYEDMTRKRITEKRFQMLSARYDSEQDELSAMLKLNPKDISDIELWGKFISAERKQSVIIARA